MTITAFVTGMYPLRAALVVSEMPDRPVKLVVPSPAGGPPDIMARLLSDKMAAALGQPVIVENDRAEPGARSALNRSQPQNCGNIRTCCWFFGEHRSLGSASVCER